MEPCSKLLIEARTYSKNSQYSDAEPLFKEALTIKRQNGSLEDVINVTAELGDVLFMQSKFAEAEDYYESAITLIKDLKDWKLKKGECCMRLGTTLRELGRFIEARDYLKEALELIITSPKKYENHGDPEVDPDAAKIYHNLAEVMYHLCEEEDEIRYRTIAKNINLTLKAIDGPTKPIIRRYVKPFAMKAAVNDNKVYKMSANKRGRCLIINIRDFVDGPVREGSEIDQANMSNVFEQLKFEVQVENEVSAQGLIETVKNWVDKEENKKYDVFVVVIMSHGKDNEIMGNDMKYVKQHDILSNVYASENLKGKPRLIIVQACKGDDISKTVDNKNEEKKVEIDKAGHDDQCDKTDAGPSKCCLPRQELDTVDCCIMNASMDGFAAHRSAETGSPFIAALTEALFEHSHTKHIEEIFDEASKLMKDVKQEPIMKKFRDGRKLYFL